MGAALDDLIDLLELEQLEVNLFRGLSPDEDRQRVFGGQVAAQALIAAGRTVDHGHVHSLHAYFLRPGDPRIPIIFDVDRIRDGRSFTTRHVSSRSSTAARDLQPVGFVPRGRSAARSINTRCRAAPDPDSLPTMRERLEPFAEKFPPTFVDWIRRERPIDTRSSELPRWLSPVATEREPEQLVWFRANGKLPDDRAAARVHRGVRIRPDAARHRGDGARALVGRRPVHDREPRPRDVVPPAAASRRVAPLPPEEPVGAGRTRASRRASSTAKTARSRSR